ncbi:MAG: DUF1883 domain-containing protein [Bacteroidetes bacterium]|nr:MAG: DUF1883 domain-containing protein [Bacteroidota bacterium]
MNYLHYEYPYLNVGTRIEVKLDKQANARLLDESNFRNYHNGRQYNFYGGLVTVTPFYLTVPFNGKWHVAIDLGGQGGTINAEVKVL